jgi:hypothetical protein
MENRATKAHDPTQRARALIVAARLALGQPLIGFDEGLPAELARYGGFDSRAILDQGVEVWNDWHASHWWVLIDRRLP